MIEHWIIPCNLKVFDVITHFKTNKQVVWKNSFTIKAGDIAYIYLGQPYSELKFKCRVISNDVDDELLKNNSYAIPAKKSNNYFSKREKYIVMELLQEFPDKALPLDQLRKNGLGQVQIQARTDKKLLKHIMLIEEQLIDERGVK